MIEVVVFAEGPSDELFIKRVVSPFLQASRIFLKPQTLHTSRDATGGAVTFDRLCHNVRNTLRQSDRTYLTTFLDLYGLAADMPGLVSLPVNAEPGAKALHVEAALHQALHARLGFRPDRLLVHVQPYELEGLFFANTDALAAAVPDWSSAAEVLSAVRQGAQTPEHINDGYETKPSARLAKLLRPSYRKTSHAPLIGQKIGLQTIMATCEHFSEWVNRLQKLQPL